MSVSLVRMPAASRSGRIAARSGESDPASLLRSMLEKLRYLNIVYADKYDLDRRKASVFLVDVFPHFPT